MNIEENNQVQDELVQDQTQETQEETHNEAEEPTEVQRASDKEENFRHLREKYDKERKEKEDLLKIFMHQQQQYQQASQKKTVEEPEEEYDPDDNVTNARMKKEMQKLRKELQQMKQEQDNVSVDVKIKSQYPDFDRVVSPQNIDILRETEPELAAALHRSGDSYNVAVSAYKLIKKLGIFNEGVSSPEKDLVQNNAKKAKSAASINPSHGSPLSRANAYSGEFTDEMKDMAYREMMQIIKNK